MPIDKRRESKLIAVIYADVSGDGDADVGRPPAARPRASQPASSRRPSPNRSPRPAPAASTAPWPTRRRRRSASACCARAWRRSQLRVGVGIGTVEHVRDSAADGRDVYSVARRALQLAVRDDGLCRYLGTGEAGDVLLGALCRLVDPLIRARTQKQWEAIAAYRELGHQRDVAEQARSDAAERGRPPDGRPPPRGGRSRRGRRHVPELPPPAAPHALTGATGCRPGDAAGVSPRARAAVRAWRSRRPGRAASRPRAAAPARSSRTARGRRAGCPAC